MQQVVCPECSVELGEEEDEGGTAYCPFCGCTFDVESILDLAELYSEREDDDRRQWIPDRDASPRLPN